MSRIELVNERVKELNAMTDMELAEAIVKYFKENATMPGERLIKEWAGSITGEFTERVITGLLSDVRKEIIEEFASLCVKETRLKNVRVLNDTKKTRDAVGRRAHDLPMVLKDVRPKGGVVTNVYEMPVLIQTAADLDTLETTNTVAFRDENNHMLILADLPEGFKKNHKEIANMQATVVVTDHSNGKFANMSYRLLIDLGQTAAA